MSKSLTALCWSMGELAEGIHELAKRSGLIGDALDRQFLTEPLPAQDCADLSYWLEWLSARLGLEAEAVETTIPNCEQLLAGAGPAIIKVAEDEAKFLLLLKVKAGQLQLLGPDLDLHRCSLEVVRAALCASYEAPIDAELEQLLTLAEVSKRRRTKVKALMLRERLAGQTLSGFWIIRQSPSTGFWQQLLHERLPNRLLMMLAVFTLIYGLEIIGWALIGQGALNGRLDFGWLIAWALLVLSLIPLNMLGSWLDATFALDMGRILKKRLLTGALRMDLQAVKHQGAGQLLSQVMESQALESLALNGGFAVVIALIELVFAALVLVSGSGGLLHLGLLLAWIILTVLLCQRYFRRMSVWTRQRLDMTHDLVERMIGHRTRLAQESAARRAAQEDQMLHDYFNSSKAMDDGIMPILGVLSRGWLIVGLLGVAPAFITGATHSAGLAISLGGILLANRALASGAAGLSALTRAGIAWTKVAMLFNSAYKVPGKEAFISSSQLDRRSQRDTTTPLIVANDLTFRYRPEGEPILRGVTLAIYPGERLLFEGPSGGGKSSLASLLVGLHGPDSGLLLLNGLDRHTLGDAWHSLTTEAPQFHENHIFSGTLAFNLLMSRNWPASDAQLQEAKAICLELGLGELLERMPAGLMQMVGETGWQLSHGERSRIFLARALLQKAQLTILDESFAALDPESLDKCLTCAFARSNTLVVIAHP